MMPLKQETIDHLLACEDLILELRNLPDWQVKHLSDLTRARIHLRYKAICNRRGDKE